MAPSKTHVPSQLTSQLVSINALFNSPQSQNLLQSHSHGASSTTASGSGSSNSAPRPSMSEMSGHGSIGPGNTDLPQPFYYPGKTAPPVCFSFRSAETLSLVGESGEYLEPDAYLEEDELISGEDVLSDVTINSNRPQVKRRRLYRAPRERQRGRTG